MVHGRTSSHDMHYTICWNIRQTDTFHSKTAKQEMKTIFHQTAKRHGISIKHLEITSDFVYLTVSFPPTISASTALKTLKGATARIWMTKHPMDGPLWDNHYLIATDKGERNIEHYIKQRTRRES